MKITLGSGHKKEEGFITIDNDPLTNPDILMNIETDIFPIEDNTVEEIRAYHIFEHIGAGFFNLMKELYRISKHECILDIRVPHHNSYIFYGDCSHIRPITIDNLKQFSKKYNNWYKDKWKSSSGFGFILDIDFEIIAYENILDEYWRNRFETMSSEEQDFAIRSYNNVIGESWIKMMVIK